MKLFKLILVVVISFCYVSCKSSDQRDKESVVDLPNAPELPSDPEIPDEPVEPDPPVTPANDNLLIEGNFSYDKILSLLNGEIYFTALNSLWKTDGRKSNTLKVHEPIDFSIGRNSDKISIDVNGVLIFAAENSTHGVELWRTDGTSIGTKILKDIKTGNLSSVPRSLLKIGSWVYFIAEDTQHGREIWRTNGQTESTELFLDIKPNDDPFSDKGSVPTILGYVNNNLLYTSVFQPGLWSINTSTLQIEKISDTYNRVGNEFHGKIYFTNQGGKNVYSSDGTQLGTQFIGTYNFLQSSSTISSDESNLYIAGTERVLHFDSSHNILSKFQTSNYINTGSTYLNFFGDYIIPTFSPSLNIVRGDLYSYYSVGGSIYRTDGTTSGSGVVIDADVPPNLQASTVINDNLYYKFSSEVSTSGGYSCKLKLVASDGSYSGKLVFFDRSYSAGLSFGCGYRYSLNYSGKSSDEVFYRFYERPIYKLFGISNQTREICEDGSLMHSFENYNVFLCPSIGLISEDRL